MLQYVTCKQSNSVGLMHYYILLFIIVINHMQALILTVSHSLEQLMIFKIYSEPSSSFNN